MTEEQEKEAKRRIFDAAVSLFARKGYAAVGCREIAKAANVNISMICYYFGTKVDILKAIINEGYDRYYHTILNIGDENAPPRERVRLIVQNLVRFFRANTELAMVAFNALPIDIPEIVNLKIKWLSANREAADRIFTQFGLDTNDMVQMGVIRGFLTSVVSTHFQAKYAWEHIVQAPNKSKEAREFIEQEPEVELDDSFYERYSEILADLYSHVLNSIATHNSAKRKGGNAQTKQARRKK